METRAPRWQVDESTGPSTALPESLKIEIEQADPRNQAGVLNVGWWGMALQPDTEYKGSFYAKADCRGSWPAYREPGQ